MEAKHKIILIWILIIIAILIIGLLLWMPKTNTDAVDEREPAMVQEEIANILNADNGIREFLEEDVYTYEEGVTIEYENSQLVASINGQSISLDENQKQKLISIFDELKCMYISLRFELDTKIIFIAFENVMLSDDSVYCYSLSYTPKDRPSLGEEILPNWYCDVLFYT